MTISTTELTQLMNGPSVVCPKHGWHMGTSCKTCHGDIVNWEVVSGRNHIARLQSRCLEYKAEIERLLEKAEHQPPPAWRPISTAPKDRTIIVGSPSKYIAMYFARYRHGNLGEPQQDTLAWRCNSSGRFATPTHWQEAPDRPE